MENITVIGGTGFIGDYLLKNLTRRGDSKICAIYKTTPPSVKLREVKYFQTDTAKISEEFYEILKETDYLVILSRPNSKILENIISANLIYKKILYASTLLLYPNSLKKQDEEFKLNPANDYEKDKIEDEKLLIDFAQNTGNKLTIARLTNIYGDVKNRGVIHWIFSAFITQETFEINNGGKPIRDFMFVEDVAEYLKLLLFLDQKEKIEIYNVCTEIGFNLNQLILEIESITKKGVKTKPGKSTEEKFCVIGSNKKIIQATGYKPKFDLKSGLKKTYQNYLKN